MVLVVENLEKQIGKHKILKDISFKVEEKEIVGFLGPNGSGKSTTMKCICGLYHMTSGSISIAGFDIQKERKKALNEIGVSIESPSLYPQLTGKDHLRMMGRWRNVGKERIKEMEEYSGLGQHLNKVTQGYSMGMKMRLMIAITLLAKPKLIILDEPTNGLDPQAIFELRKQMENIREEGASILFSSHQLGEVEKLADRVVILKQGEKVYEGVIPTNLIEGIKYHIQVSNRESAIEYLIKNGIKNCHKIKEKEEWIEISIQKKEQLNYILSLLQSAHILVYDIIKCEIDLENFYKAIYEGRYLNDQSNKE